MPFKWMICALALFFGPPPAFAADPGLSLESAIEEGSHNNPDLAAARIEIPMARAEELSAGLWGNPALQLGASFEPLPGDTSQPNDNVPGSTSIGITLPLDLSGKHSASRQSAGSAAKISEFNYLDVLRQKVVQIELGYIDVMVMHNMVLLAAEKAGDYEKLVHILEHRMGSNSVRPLFLVRAHLARDQAHLDLRQKRAELSSVKSRLAILLGRAPDSEFEALTELRDFSLNGIPAKEKTVALALEARPDYLALKMAESKAEFDQALARNQAWDDFELGLTLGRQKAVPAVADDPDSVEVPTAYSLQAALTIPIPLFNRNQGNSARAKLQKTQSQKHSASLELSIRQEIGDALQLLQLNHDLILEYESTQVKNARAVRDSEQTQFGTGYIALLDYFDAVEAYNGVLSSYYQTVGSFRKDVARLNAAAGREVME